MESEQFPMRINKYLALKKHSTRRGADELIKKNQVFINNKLAVLGSKVEANDVVEVKFRGRPTPMLYFAYYKPKGMAIQEVGAEKKEDEKIRKTNKTHSPSFKGMFPVGGLEKESSGLVIFTNDGRITERLLSPQYAVEKEYVATTREKLRSSFKEKMESGVKIDDVLTKKCKVRIMDDKIFRITLTEERRNQIRRMCVALFQEVNSLKRVRIGTISLEKIKEGGRRRIEGSELRIFLESLGL